MSIIVHGKRHELIDGEHYVTPSQAIRHQSVVGALHLLIGNYLEQHPIGRTFLSPLDVVVSEIDGDRGSFEGDTEAGRDYQASAV